MSPFPRPEESPAGEIRHVDSLRRGEWTVRGIEHDEATEAVERWHYAQGCPNTSVFRHGLFRANGAELLGVAMWLPPTKNAAATVAGKAWRNVLALTRFVVAEKVPPNGESFLLGASMRLVDRLRWPWLLTYADSGRGHDGGIYRATNWTYLGPWDAGDTWLGPSGEQRGRKRGGRNLSVVEMREQGFEKAPAAVKHKYVQHVGRPVGNRCRVMRASGGPLRSDADTPSTTDRDGSGE